MQTTRRIQPRPTPTQRHTGQTHHRRTCSDIAQSERPQRDQTHRSCRGSGSQTWWARRDQIEQKNMPPTRPGADPRIVTREGGSAPGLWEALRVQPSRVFESQCSNLAAIATAALRTLRTLRTATHNAGRADAAAADAPESAPVSRVSTWHEASVVRCRAWRGWGSGTPCHDEEAVAAVVEELPRHLRHSGVRSRASLHSWRANRCSWPISCQCDAGTGRAAARRAAQSRRSFPVQQRTKIPVQQRTICEDRAALAAGGLCGTCRAAMA